MEVEIEIKIEVEIEGNRLVADGRVPCGGIEPSALSLELVRPSGPVDL
ncbi:hypothetical protein [uncultured Dialister sp.]|jgi:hypothetical protein|nr:hypothetical protein [uncultured Dialister sp.]